MTHRKSSLALAFCFLFLAGPLFAGQIRFVKTLTPSAPDERGIYTIIDGEGVATAIDGFDSLAGLAPSSLTFRIHVKLSDLKLDPETGEFVAVLGPDPAAPHTTQFFQNGALIAHTSDAVYVSAGNVVENHAQSRSREHLNGVAGHPFHEEVRAQTRGTAGLVVTFDRYPAQQAGAFQVTGTITTVPPFEVRVEPQGAIAGDNLTLVISGAACNAAYSAAELAAGAATVVHDAECLGVPAAFETRVPLGVLPAGEYKGRSLDARGALQAEAEFTVAPRPLPTTDRCVPDAHVLCLQGGRFRVEATLDEPGLTAQGGKPKARLLSVESGAFSFFSRGNPELFVKVLDGCQANGHYWLFTSGLTNLAATVNVYDFETGARHIIANPSRTPFLSRADTRAFACSD